MPILALLLVLEIGVASLLINIPNKTYPPASKKVLGNTILLAEDVPPTDATPTDTTPTDTSPSTTPPETSNTTPQLTPPPTDTSPASTETALPTTIPNEATSTPSSEQPTATATSPEILNTDQAITNPEKVDPQSVTEAQQEDRQLEAIQNPTDKAEALTHFASDKVSDIDHFTQTENFSSTSFANARLSGQIDQLVSLTKSIPTEKTQQRLTDLCQQVTTILRAAEETVPEELEQDLEITRSKCLNP